jgi:hypothetical protein
MRDMSFNEFHLFICHSRIGRGVVNPLMWLLAAVMWVLNVSPVKLEVITDIVF